MSLSLWTINNQWNNQYLLTDYLRFNRYLCTKITITKNSYKGAPRVPRCSAAGAQSHWALWGWCPLELRRAHPASRVGYSSSSMAPILSYLIIHPSNGRKQAGLETDWETWNNSSKRKMREKKFKVAYAKDMEMPFVSFPLLGDKEQILK